MNEAERVATQGDHFAHRPPTPRGTRTAQGPPRGYRYVQSGNDIVMVGIASGIIGAIFGNMIR